MLLKRWFLRKEVVTDISHFEVQGVYLPKELAGGGELKYQNIWNLSHFLPKFEFPLIQSSLSGAFSHLFDYFPITIIKANCDGSVAHVTLHIKS